MRKLLQTNILGTIIKFIANYIKGRLHNIYIYIHIYIVYIVYCILYIYIYIYIYISHILITSIQNWCSTRWRPFTSTIQHLQCRHTTTQSTGSEHGLRRLYHHHIYTRTRAAKNTYNHTYIHFLPGQSHTKSIQNNSLHSRPSRI